MTDKRLGRPPLGTTTPSVRIEVRATAGQRLELKRIADAHGIRFSEVVREALDDRIERAVPRPGVPRETD